MMDGSLEADGKTPADYAYNVAITRRVTDMAHGVGVSVEGSSAVSVRWRPARTRRRTGKVRKASWSGISF
jgi:hypothetical protein